MPLEFHPYADLFPLPSRDDRAEQREDIRANGLHDPIDMFEEKILDGRSRYLDLVELAAASAPLGKGWGVYEGTTLTEAELQPGAGIWWFKRFIPEESGDALDYVISKNLRRRHLTDDQRRMVAARLATLGRGRTTREIGQNGPFNQEEAANLLSVDPRGVKRARAVVTHGTEDLQHAVDRGDLSVNAAAQIATKPEEEQKQELQRRGLTAGPSPHMPNRVEPDSSLNYSPTPPWVTRALMDVVIPYVEIWPDDISAASCQEPACGEGHMAAVLEEYFGQVVASDIFDYSLDGRSPPGWEGVADFLAPEIARPGADWIITNPPFNDQTAKFMAAALDRAQTGVALFMQLRYLEGIDRYETIFKDRPPTVVAFFVERAPLHMGRWEPDGGTMTAYVWLVWVKGRAPMPPLWIPPGQREALTKPDDRERFTAHPVLPKGVTIKGDKFDPDTGELRGDEDGRGDGKQPEAAERERAADHDVDREQGDGTTRPDPKHRAKSRSIAGTNEVAGSPDVDGSSAANRPTIETAAAGNGSTLPADRTPDTGAPGRGAGAPPEPQEKTADGIPIFLLHDREKLATP